MAKVKTWVWVVLGIVVVGIVCLVAVAAAGLWFARTHIQIEQASASTMSKEFDDVAARFASQRPLIELDENGRVVRTNEDRPTAGPRPESLHILAFSPRDDKVAKLSIPFWLLRLKGPGSRIPLGNGSVFDVNTLSINVDDLQRFGPTLIVDHRGRNGERVLIWSQ